MNPKRLTRCFVDVTLFCVALFLTMFLRATASQAMLRFHSDAFICVWKKGGMRADANYEKCNKKNALIHERRQDCWV